MSDKKLIPQNRMEEYMDWLAGNKPAEGTLKPNNRSEAFMEEIAKRLDNGTGGGGGSGFEPIDSPEAAKEFATEENLGKIAQYVGPDYDVEGNFDYVDRLAVSINEEVFKNKVKSVGPVRFTIDDSGVVPMEYPGLYITEASEPDFGTFESATSINYIFTSSDPIYAEASTFIIMVQIHSDSEAMIMATAETSNVTPLVQAVFNSDKIVGGPEASGWGALLYSNMDVPQMQITKGWHSNQGIQNIPLTINQIDLSCESEDEEKAKNLALNLFKGIGETDGAGVYTFKFNGQWTPAIAEYGVSISGAMDGDEVEINYNGDGLYEVGKTSQIYFDTSKNFNGFDDGILFVGTGASGDEMIVKISDHDFYFVQVEEPGSSEQPLCVWSAASGWNARYAIQIPVMTSIFPYTITTVNNQDQWKDIVSAAPLPNFSIKQKLNARLEAEIDAEKYITTVEGKGTETFTYDNGQWVTYVTSGGTTIDGTIIACEATTIYCNNLMDLTDVNNLVATVIPETSSTYELVQILTEGQSGTDPQGYIYAANAMSTYGGTFMMCEDFHEPGFVFNGSSTLSSMVGFTGFIGQSFNTEPRSSSTLIIPEQYKAVVDQLFSLTPFEQVVVPADFNAKGITVKGTPVNGDKINIVYEDGELKSYELYRVDELTPSKYYKAGDIVDAMYFDTSFIPSNLTPFGFISNAGAILMGENGLYDEGLYWSDDKEIGFVIGTKIILGSGAFIDPAYTVYSSSKGWIKSSIALNHPIKLVDSWTMQGTTISTDIEAAKQFVQKCPIGEEPESYYGLYKFYVSPEDLANGSADGVAIVDLGMVGEGSTESVNLTLTDEQVKLMEDNDFSIMKFQLQADSVITCYVPLMTKQNSPYGIMYLYAMTMDRMKISIQASADQKKGSLRIDHVGEVEADKVKYLSYEPSEDNDDGLIFVVLNSEPSTYYNGYYYIIKDSN